MAILSRGMALIVLVPRGEIWKQASFERNEMLVTQDANVRSMPYLAKGGFGLLEMK